MFTSTNFFQSLLSTFFIELAIIFSVWFVIIFIEMLIIETIADEKENSFLTFGILILLGPMVGFIVELYRTDSRNKIARMNQKLEDIREAIENGK